jgi:hypothetical protein
MNIAAFGILPDKVGCVGHIVQFNFRVQNR